MSNTPKAAQRMQAEQFKAYTPDNKGFHWIAVSVVTALVAGFIPKSSLLIIVILLVVSSVTFITGVCKCVIHAIKAHQNTLHNKMIDFINNQK